MHRSERTYLLVAIVCILVTASVGLSKAPTSQPTPRGQFLPPAGTGKGWRLAWSDEFDAKKLDESPWQRCGDWKRRDGDWVQADAYLDGKGHLILRTTKNPRTGRFTCGAVRTKGKFEHRFGYWECRCKFPTQEGHWPAFWLFTPSVGKVGSEGRDGTEIDIMEKPWRDDRIQHALHWDGYGKHHRSKGKQVRVPGVQTGWHTFGLDWKADEYVWYVDGKETWRSKAGGVCQVKTYVKLTEEIGKWGGDIAKAKLPDEFTVDYVRVFDRVEAPKPRARFPGTEAAHVVYVIDRSGSMAPTFDEVRVELLKATSRLKPTQDFHIILFADNRFIGGPGKGLVAATIANKLAAMRFLKQVNASGQTTVLPALRRAFAILADSGARPTGRVIYLLTDGDFAGVTGGSTYTTPDGRRFQGNEAVIRYVNDHNPQGENRVRFHTLLYLSRSATAVKVMKKLADESGGSYKHISSDE